MPFATATEHESIPPPSCKPPEKMSTRCAQKGSAVTRLLVRPSPQTWFAFWSKKQQGEWINMCLCSVHVMLDSTVALWRCPSLPPLRHANCRSCMIQQSYNYNGAGAFQQIYSAFIIALCLGNVLYWSMYSEDQ